jgi:hypothetical protein
MAKGIRSQRAKRIRAQHEAKFVEMAETKFRQFLHTSAEKKRQELEMALEGKVPF